MSVCSKFSYLCFCQILFELLYSWENYHKNKKGELFIDTQCRDSTWYLLIKNKLNLLNNTSHFHAKNNIFIQL